MPGFTFASLGIVTVNKKEDDPYIKVCPIEDMSLEKGSLTGSSKKPTSTTKNTKGVQSKVSITGGAEVVAKWIQLGSVRTDAPDVVANETVMLYTYADTNEYYWTTLGDEPELRRLEKVKIRVSNQKSGFTPATDATSYYFELDSINKRVTLHTSANDGEQAAYDIVLNTREGTLEVKDDAGNSLLLNSVKGELAANIATKISLKSQRIELHASQEVLLDAPQITQSGGTVTTASALSIMNGMTAEGGSGAAVSIKGEVKVEGDVQMQGNIHATGEVTGSNIG